MAADIQFLRCPDEERFFLNITDISMSMAAPEANRTVEKLAASMVASPSAIRQNTEFAAKATSANRVHRIVLMRPTLLSIEVHLPMRSLQ